MDRAPIEEFLEMVKNQRMKMEGKKNDKREPLFLLLTIYKLSICSVS